MNRTQKRLATLYIAAAFATVAAQAQNSSPTVDSLASDLAALTARVAKLEGKIEAADLVGMYVLNGIQVELNGGNSASVSSYVLTGTVVLAADGTATLNASSAGNTLSIGTSSSVTPFKGGGGGTVTLTTTWSYADSTVTFLGTRLAVTAGGRILVASGANNSDGTNVLLILTRLQLDPASSSAVRPGVSMRRE